MLPALLKFNNADVSTWGRGETLPEMCPPMQNLIGASAIRALPVPLALAVYYKIPVATLHKRRHWPIQIPSLTACNNTTTYFLRSIYREPCNWLLMYTDTLPSVQIRRAYSRPAPVLSQSPGTPMQMIFFNLAYQTLLIASFAKVATAIFWPKSKIIALCLSDYGPMLY